MRDRPGRGAAGRRLYIVARNPGFGNAARATLAACDAVVISIGGNDLYGDPVARLTTLIAPSTSCASPTW